MFPQEGILLGDYHSDTFVCEWRLHDLGIPAFNITLVQWWRDRATGKLTGHPTIGMPPAVAEKVAEKFGEALAALQARKGAATGPKWDP